MRFILPRMVVVFFFIPWACGEDATPRLKIIRAARVIRRFRPVGPLVFVDKRTGDIQQRWDKIGSRANHLFDCEASPVCGALMMGEGDGEGETAEG
jgi:hypothetical protein